MAVRARAGRPYHHGDLPAALRSAGLDLISQHGPQGFTLAEVARRAGVAASAPYRHFQDRDDLLAAIGAEAHDQLAEQMRTLPADSPAATLVRMTAAYVSFAIQNRGAFLLMTGAGLDKSSYPQLLAASDQLLETVLEQARLHCGPRRGRKARTLAMTLWALAHGHASLAVDGGFDYVGLAATAIVEQTATAARSLIEIAAQPGT